MFNPSRLAVLALATAATSPSLAQAAASPNAGFWDVVNPYVLDGTGLLVTAVLTIAGGQFTRLTGIQISQSLFDRVHRAADTGVHAALGGIESYADQGLTGTGKLQVLGQAVSYVKTHLGGILKTLGVDETQLAAIVTSKIVKAELSRLGTGGGAAVESPAMERAAGPSGFGGR